jgi:indole-3-glycerol phosphate synthase
MLNDILATKRKELGTLTMPETVNVPRYSLYEALRHPNRSVGLIAEVKKASPSKGIIKKSFQPVTISKAYERAGADAISVLTDKTYFQGDRDYVSAIKKETALPVLRKDFIIDTAQVEESRHIGADAILLIVGSVEIGQLHDLYKTAEENGLECLVEVHSKEDLDTLLNVFTPKIIGINNRDLKTFQTSLSQSKRLAPFIPEDSVFVSESGISSKEDIGAVKSYGANAVLAGEVLMRALSPEEGINTLFGGETVDPTSH